jgi:hypothetical protein
LPVRAAGHARAVEAPVAVSATRAPQVDAVAVPVGLVAGAPKAARSPSV